MWVSHPAIILLALIRCHSCSDFEPVRRYHPATKFNSNSQDELVTAENFQYAYGGGESEGEVNYSHDHDVEFGHSTGQGNSVGFSTGLEESHHDTSGFEQGHHDTSGFEQGHHDTSGFEQGHHETVGTALHTGEVDLTGSDQTGAGSELGYQEHIPFSQVPYHHDGYSYGPPVHGYQYLPPPHHPALPAITAPPPPPPPAQEAKQNPSFTYYYLGRHLWYIPLYFSIYFILYVGALVLKSVARHKILFPEQLKVAAQQGRALKQLERATRRYNM